MAKPLTTTSNALLGLLSIQPWSTYELAKQVDRSLGWFWPRTERKIYDEAKKLVESGHATAKLQATGSRPRTVYKITAKGRRTLQAWLDESSAPPKLEAEALVRVFFANAGTLDQLRTTLDDLAAQSRANMDELRVLIATADDADYSFAERRHINAIAIRFQLDYNQMISDWAEWATAQTDSWNDITDPNSWDWHSALT
ncbi:MAG: PadR family transcriptional regulator [Acidimicrobiaceae bacterium]|nr:PadR family transcriptional regulator [Acidimicrobiaceae bacterium]